jgi:hypothetical protein
MRGLSVDFGSGASDIVMVTDEGTDVLAAFPYDLIPAAF